MYNNDVSAPTTSVSLVSEVPDLDRMVINDASLPKEAVQILEKNIKKVSDELRLDSNNLSLWLDLGIQRKIAGDYEGARDAWDYASKIRPKNSVSFGNLGDLYAYYLKDTKKAEKNFLKAIENGPDEIYLYFKTSDFYKYIMKDTEKARAIVEQGVETNPNSKELQSLLNSL